MYKMIHMLDYLYMNSLEDIVNPCNKSISKRLLVSNLSKIDLNSSNPCK